MKTFWEKIKSSWKWIVGIFIGAAVAGTVANFTITTPPLTNIEIAEQCIATKKINECLTNLNAKEKADLKGKEIAKIGSVARQNVKFSGADYDIEILSFNPITGGVELFARVWDSQGQIGFGLDGSVDIERFRIFNPPILVDDPTGTITLSWVEKMDGSSKQRILKEDPKLAVLQTLAHTIKVSTKNNPRNKIIIGKVGRTTSTFFPDPDPETTSVDGQVQKDDVKDTFANIRGAAGTGFNDSGASTLVRVQTSTTPSGNYDSMYVGINLFDSSAIPDTDTITSAVTSYFGVSKTDQLSQSIVLTNSNPASNTALANGDYTNHIANMGTELGTARITITNFSTTGYNDFTITSPNTNVSKTGVTKLGIRTSADFDNAEPTWVASNQGAVSYDNAETAGTSSDPKLVVTHASPSSTKKQSEIFF